MYIKILFRNGESITLPYEQAEMIMNAEEQLVMLYGEDGKWTGESINKADISRTLRDKDEEWGGGQTFFPSPDYSPLPKDQLKKLRPDFVKVALKHASKE